MVLVGYILLLLISFYLLAQISEKYFIPALDKIAKELKLSNDMAGATLMAVGSSAPELFVALIAVLKPGDHIEIGMGTIVGSAIFNILVIIGAVAVVRTAVINWQPILRDTIFYTISILFLLFAFNDGVIKLYEAIVFVLFYVFYVFMVLRWERLLHYHEKEPDKIENDEHEHHEHWWQVLFKPLDYIMNLFFPSPRHYYISFFVSIAAIGAICWILVESAIHVSEILNIPEIFIAMIVLAAGTSVPDLMSSVIVARQGRGGMAISNAVGSNIFDILIGLGLPWLLVLTFSSNSIDVSKTDFLGSTILLLGSVVAVFILLAIRHWKINPKAGYVLIGLYFLYLAWEIIKI